MDDTGRELLTQLARDLLVEAEYVPTVLQHGAGAAPGRLGAYILAQGVSTPADFQLPEPILHPFECPRVLVIGFNPNHGPREDIPRYGAKESDYVDFYAHRFASHRRDALGHPAHRSLDSDGPIHIGHYHDVEQMLAGVLESPLPFGDQAVYCDAIPWKWKQDSGPSFGKADGAIAYHRLDRIINALRPAVVLTMGDRSARIVGDWTKDKPLPNGRNNGDWPVWHVASYHPGARAGKFRQNRQAVQQALSDGLRLGPRSSL